MVFLRIHLAVFLAALFLSGCKFDPAVTGLGYQTCDTTADCKSGGLVCLNGLCVPDCSGVHTVAWLEPETRKDAEWICPRGECGVNEGKETGLAYLDVELPPVTFLELGSTKDEVESCNRVVIRFSVLAPDMHPETQGRDLSVVIRGKEATGVVPDDQDGKIKLEIEIEGENLNGKFRENTYFYVVDTGIFDWPVRLRLVNITSNRTAFFIRDFEMSCCE